VKVTKLKNKHCCVRLKTYIFITVFQFYNRTWCPLRKATTLYWT